MSEPTHITLGHVPQPVAQGQECGSWDAEVFFVAPIDLLPDDEVVIDSASRKPLAIYREKVKIWELEGYYMSGFITSNLTTDADGLSALLDFFGRKP